MSVHHTLQDIQHLQNACNKLKNEIVDLESRYHGTRIERENNERRLSRERRSRDRERIQAQIRDAEMNGRAIKATLNRRRQTLRGRERELRHLERQMDSIFRSLHQRLPYDIIAVISQYVYMSDPDA